MYKYMDPLDLVMYQKNALDIIVEQTPDNEIAGASEVNVSKDCLFVE